MLSDSCNQAKTTPRCCSLTNHCYIVGCVLTYLRANPGPAGNESHAGQVFTCVAALAIVDGLQHVDQDLLSWW